MTPPKSEMHSIFISHRHIDRRIADVFRETVEAWSDSAIKVYQSSHSSNASRISADLDEAISEAIANCSIVLLIYTQAPGDMDWCMYECGLAQDPRSRATRIAVFHTTESPPDPLDGLISMRLEHESVLKFAHQFHKDPMFMPGTKQAVSADISDEDLHERAHTLYQQLKKAAPERSREATVYDRITFGLSYAKAEELMKMAEKNKLETVHTHACKILPGSLSVRSTSGDPGEHFNFSSLGKGTGFDDLVARWRSDSNFAKGNYWMDGVCEAITRAILQRPEREVAIPFNSLTSDGGSLLLPILARHRTVPFERIIEFDLLLCRVRKETALRMIDL